MSREPTHGNPPAKITTRDPAVDQIVERARKNWELLKRKGTGGYPGSFPYIPVEERLFSNILEDGEWQSQRCFVIGGGPSLRDFDFSKLKGELVIGVNRAHEKMDCTIMFSMDDRYFSWIIRGRLDGGAREKFLDFKGYKVWLNASRYQFPKDIYQLGWVGGHGFSQSLKDGLGGGSNSGFGAVNLATCLGANPIYLLGFDMKGDNGKQAWWHGGYPSKQPSNVYAKYTERFNGVASELKQRGVKVINLNPDSALRCFEFGKFEDIKPIKRPIIISFYTKNTDYEREKEGLISSLRRFNLEYDIEAIENRGDWQKNTYYKAEFIRKKLNQYPKRDVCWIDVDVVIERYPFLFNNMKADLAVHYIDWQKYDQSRGKELNTSVLYVANNERARRLLDLWIIENKGKIDTGTWEQKNLQNILKNYEDINIFNLPATYCKIFDSMRGINKPVIQLYQASRHFRREVGS